MASKRRHSPESAAQTLEAIEGFGDRVAAWVAEHPIPILGTALAILAVAGAVGLMQDSVDEASVESASALAQVQHAYKVAMGGNPGSVEVPEPANPETARRARAEAVAGYEAVASGHPDTAAAALALLEAGKLQQQMDEPEAALASFQRGLDAVPPDHDANGLLWMRIASVHEAQGRYGEAGDASMRAAAVPDFPLAPDALATAARCFALAGNAEAALAAQDRLVVEAPDVQLAPYVEARLAELRRGPSSAAPSID